jgi:hypothetical protein
MQLLAGQRRPEIGVTLVNQSERMVNQRVQQLVILRVPRRREARPSAPSSR